MLITEKNKKLNIDFEKDSDADICLYKDEDGVHAKIGNQIYGDGSSPSPTVETVWEHGKGAHSAQTIQEGADLNNAAGEASVSEGIGTDAHALASHAEGGYTSAGKTAKFSHVEGYRTSTQGEASHAEGDNTVTNNPAEHAEGKYNKSNMGGTSATNTISSIGIGNASSEIPGGTRKNAVEVMQNGDVYIIGIGGYDGQNMESAQTVQEVINSLINR